MESMTGSNGLPETKQKQSKKARVTLAYVDGPALVVTNWLLGAEGALFPTELTAATCNTA